MADGVNVEELRFQVPSLLWVPLWFPLLIYQIALNAIYESKFSWQGVGWFFVLVCSIYTGWKISGMLMDFVQKAIRKTGQQDRLR